MTELSLTWYAAVISVIILIVRYLAKSFAKAPAEDLMNNSSISGNWVKEEKKKGAKGKKKQQNPKKKSPSPPPAEESTVVEKKGSKTTRLRKEKGTELTEKVEETKSRGIANLDDEDDEGFVTVVGSRTKGMMKKISKMTPSEKSSFLAEQERKEDAKWDISDDVKVGKSKNAFMLPKVEGKPVPKKKTERKTATSVPSTSGSKIHLTATPEMLAEIERLRTAETTLPEVIISYKVGIEGSWYPITELLETADFAHAESLYKRWVSKPESCLGSYFIKIDSKEWTGASTADEPWVVSGWVPALLKIISGEKEAFATVCTEGDWRVRMSLVAEDTLQLEHVDRPAKLSSMIHKVSLKQFAEVFQQQMSLLVDFTIKIESVSSDYFDRMTELRDSNPERADRNLERHAVVQGRVPKSVKLSQLLDKLSEAAILKWG